MIDKLSYTLYLNITKDQRHLHMSEKRIYKRQNLICYLRVFETKTGKLIGHLVDISPEGIMVMCSLPVEPDKVYSLRIVIERGLSDKELIDFEARSRWCRKEEGAHFFDCGYELTAITEENRSKIEKMIASLCVSNG